MGKFDWMKHMHDRLGHIFVKLITSEGHDIKEFGLLEPNGPTDIDIRITVNGHEISYEKFIEKVYEVDDDQLERAARDIIDVRFGDKLDAVENALEDVRKMLNSDIFDELRPEWKRVVADGPRAFTVGTTVLARETIFVKNFGTIYEMVEAGMKGVVKYNTDDGALGVKWDETWHYVAGANTPELRLNEVGHIIEVAPKWVDRVKDDSESQA